MQMNVFLRRNALGGEVRNDFVSGTKVERKREAVR